MQLLFLLIFQRKSNVRECVLRRFYFLSIYFYASKIAISDIKKEVGLLLPKIYLNNLLKVFFPTIPSTDNPFLD